MSDYNRTTRECSVSQLHPEIRQSIQNYFREKELGDPQTEAILCCETVSERKDSGTLDSLFKDNTADMTIYMGMLLTSQLLIWVRKGDKSGIVLNSADLREIKVNTHSSLFMKDNGLDISGFIGDDKARVRGYIGMGSEPAAYKFLEEVVKAVTSANPPVKKSWADIFGR